MSTLPKINVQGWHNDGPVYQIERKLDGRRNRHLRRAVERGEAEAIEQIGKPGGRNSGKPAAHQVFTSASAELWLLNKGHVYELTVFIDDDLHELLVDAREDYGQFSLGADMELHDWRELDDDEIAELDSVDEETQPSDSLVDGSPAEEGSDREAELRQLADELGVDLEELEGMDAADIAQLREESGDDEDAVGGDSGKSSSDEEE